MFKIKDNIIHITRGDKASINFAIDGYKFKTGDTLKLKVYEKNKLNYAPILKIKETITIPSEKVDFKLSSDETKFGKYENSVKEYWYEVTLNDEETLLGYDEDGAKILYLYPEGAE